MLAWKGAYGLSDHDGITSPAYAVFEVDTAKIDRRYLHHRTRSRDMQVEFRSRSKGIIESRLRLYPDALLAMKVELPDLPSQKQIAAFLDRETARIDELIAKKERLVEVLKEKRAAGLEMLVSQEGVRKVAFRRLLLKIEQGWSPECEARLVEGDEWGVLKVGCVNSWNFNSSEHKALPSMLKERPELEVRQGDILMSRANTPDLVGSVSMVGDVPPRLMLCDKLYRLLLDTRMVVRPYAVMFLRSKLARDHYSSSSNGASSSMQNISQEIVRSLQMPLPSLDKQEACVKAFDSLNAKAAKLCLITIKSIDRLSEYRAALITAAVTGQINVETYGKSGTTSAALDRIEKELQA